MCWMGLGRDWTGAGLGWNVLDGLDRGWTGAGLDWNVLGGSG